MSIEPLVATEPWQIMGPPQQKKTKDSNMEPDLDSGLPEKPEK